MSVPLIHPLWAGGRCCGGQYVVVPALEDCTPDLRWGVVTVCRWGREVVVGDAEAGGAEGGVAVWWVGLCPLFRMVEVCRVIVPRWGSW